jgi:hypothetical protein
MSEETNMHSGERPARERIIAAELMKLERRQAIERAALRARPRRPGESVHAAEDVHAWQTVATHAAG